MLTTGTITCPMCDGCGWVCESHPNQPHEHYVKVFGFKIECGGAGMPCKCNKANPPWEYDALEAAKLKIEELGK